MQKQNLEKEKIIAQTRNYMLPSYHDKTHFKAAKSIQIQTGEPSLAANED
jgi:hypothetical protein